MFFAAFPPKLLWNRLRVNRDFCFFRGVLPPICRLFVACLRREAYGCRHHRRSLRRSVLLTLLILLRFRRGKAGFLTYFLVIYHLSVQAPCRHRRRSLRRRVLLTLLILLRFRRQVRVFAIFLEIFRQKPSLTSACAVLFIYRLTKENVVEIVRRLRLHLSVHMGIYIHGRRNVTVA